LANVKKNVLSGKIFGLSDSLKENGSVGKNSVLVILTWTSQNPKYEIGCLPKYLLPL